jgi:hypothetical protein
MEWSKVPRHPIREIWFSHERREWEKCLNVASKKRNGTLHHQRRDQRRSGVSSGQNSQPRHPKLSLGPVSAGIEPAGWEKHNKEATVCNLLADLRHAGRSKAEVDRTASMNIINS